MFLMLKNHPVMEIRENGVCEVRDLERLPFGLRREKVTFPEFAEWVSNRSLSIGRSYAKEILNSLKLSQTNRYAVSIACRGVSLEDSYWILQEGDERNWEDVNLFHNHLSLFLAELALSGSNIRQDRPKQDTLFEYLPEQRLKIHTPELTTLGVSAKGWIRGEDGLYLHKTGICEIPASRILDCLQIPHILYEESSEEEIRGYLSEQRRAWLEGVGERMVKSRLFTGEDMALVTFEEFSVFCRSYGLNPYEEAAKIDRTAYLQMQLADYLLNNSDRHGQNWGFFMENDTGQLTGYCPLFDHDRSFSTAENVISQTTEQDMTLEEAARAAQQELRWDLAPLFEMKCHQYLGRERWLAVLKRAKRL